MIALALASLVLWLVIAALPFRPWSTRERIEPRPDRQAGAIGVIIPARNEAESIRAVVTAARGQAPGIPVLVVDDGSEDATGRLAEEAGATVLPSAPLPAGWTGKLWALHQGLQHVSAKQVLFLDADIELTEGMLAGLQAERDASGAPLVSVLARYPVGHGWEKLLAPAFVYFFRLLYPFALANRPGPVAAAAGGCMLVDRETLVRLGGVAALRDALIDDCALAQHFKRAGCPVRVGLTHGARSLRRHRRLASFWNMIARTAFDQLRYSTLLLLATSALMAMLHVVPLVALFLPPAAPLGAAALGVMALTYLPTVRYLGLAWPWCLSLPAAALLFLAMTWCSAWRYWRGERSRWKGRRYRTGSVA